MADSREIVALLSQTLSANGEVVRAATDLLDRLSQAPDFPFSLLTVVAGCEDHGVRIAAATFLKNLLRRSLCVEGQSGFVSKEFRNQLLRALLHSEPRILKVLVEAFRVVVDVEFVKNNAWPEIVPELKHAIQHSNCISGQVNGELRTINALTVLQALVRPFQYFLNPKVVKEPVPIQLELIASEILVPLLAAFHGFVDKDLAVKGIMDMETEKTLLLVGKCMYYAVRSYMPSALAPLLHSFCHDLYAILNSLSLERMTSSEDIWQVRLKTGKRSLLFFCSLITRHRKHSDKLMPEIVNCALRIVKYSKDISGLDMLPERIISIAFDVISHVLETGPGWRLVSPHFSTLLESAILPALLLNEKDTMEWEEDADEFLRKNFPSDLEEISGWRDDLFTARKSAVNLLGVFSMSKGPPLVTSGSSLASSKRKKSEKNRGKHQRCSVGELLVIPFLSKVPIPCDANPSDAISVGSYFGVLMGYGGLLDFLREQKPEYSTALIQNRILPLYTAQSTLPYLIAAANWVLGELASCLPEDMSTDVYSSLLKALTTADSETMSCYPVRVTAAGAIATLLDNDYKPPEWLPLLQVIIGRIGYQDEDSSLLFQLLGSVVEAGGEEVAVHIPAVVPTLIGTIAKCIPAVQEPWPQVVIRGFTALAVMANTWHESEPVDDGDEFNSNWAAGRATIARAFSSLLQQAWLAAKQNEAVDNDDDGPCQSCVDDASILLCFIMRSITANETLIELNLPALLVAWAELISNWHAWEELEDIPVFDCIKEVANLQKNFDCRHIFQQLIPPPPAPPVPKQSIVEAISAFVAEAITQYPSAMRRACSCIHILLHSLTYSFEMEDLKKSLVVTFSQAAISRFREMKSKPNTVQKPLLLALASCYLCYPDIVDKVSEKDESGGFSVWVRALCSTVSSLSSEDASTETEIKLIVIVLAKLVDQLLQKGSSFNSLSQQCFNSLLEACIQMKAIQDENDDDDEEEEEAETEDEDETDEDEDSEEEFHEETEEAFLERYAKAAAALGDNGDIEEGDTEDDEELELDFLEELDEKKTLQSLFQRYQQVIAQGHGLSPELIPKFLESFPEYSPFFHQLNPQ